MYMTSIPSANKGPPAPGTPRVFRWHTTSCSGMSLMPYLRSTVFSDLHVLSYLCHSIPTIRLHNPAFFTGLESFSLPDPVVQRSSCTNVTPQSLTSRMPRANVYVIFVLEHSNPVSYHIEERISTRKTDGNNSIEIQEPCCKHALPIATPHNPVTRLWLSHLCNYRLPSRHLPPHLPLSLTQL
ncbi:hypothetical protein F4604DRAFT_484821 [Suillus subluteus]|nr:hypothetical protein F4604DRAFT_484821 [Suillus subluteus]